MNSDDFSVETTDLSFRSLARALFLFLLPLSAYIIGLLPVMGFYVVTIRLFPYTGILFFAYLTVILVLCFLLFIVFETFVPAVFIRLFHIRVEEGEYDLSLKDKGFYNHLLFFALYRPSLLLIGIIPLVPLRILYLKMVGLKIGKESMVAGTELIDEPYALIIGDHTLIGGYVFIYTHLSYKKMINKKVRIGNNCFIGNKSMIFPGVTIEDNVIVKPGSVIPENSVLEKDGIYEGNPIHKIS